MAQVKNISTGPRGAYLKGVYVEALPGQVIEADDFADEWFGEIDEADNGFSGMTVAELKALAAEEGIDLGDASKKVDIISAIELGREAAN